MLAQQPMRTASTATYRQRPSAASGVTFVTLEDETGTINVVVWHATAEKYRRALLGATLLTVTGHVERVETSTPLAMHMIAARHVDRSHPMGDHATSMLESH